MPDNPPLPGAQASNAVTINRNATTGMLILTALPSEQNLRSPQPSPRGESAHIYVCPGWGRHAGLPLHGLPSPTGRGAGSEGYSSRPSGLGYRILRACRIIPYPPGTFNLNLATPTLRRLPDGQQWQAPGLRHRHRRQHFFCGRLPHRLDQL
jgi:hypothetical protein